MFATPKEVLAFRARNGRVPFEEWLDDIGVSLRTKLMKSIDYKELLHKRLEDPEQAAEYLTACYAEGPEVFLVGLRDVVEARGGVSQTARLTKLNRESLYRVFSKSGNPRLSSLSSVLSALGLKLTVEPA